MSKKVQRKVWKKLEAEWKDRMGKEKLCGREESIYVEEDDRQRNELRERKAILLFADVGNCRNTLYT